MTGGWRAGARASAAVLLCAVLLGAPAGCASTETAPDTETDGPACNLLLITVDTLRADHLSACGHPHQLTPHLDGLSRQGTLIPGAVTPANTTLPAHASLLTSLPPEGHGGFGNGLAIRRDLPTLAGACRDAGMATAAMVSSWVVGTGWNLEQGFDEYLPLYQTERRPSPSSPGRVLPLRAADTSRAACRWLLARTDRPFMLWLHYMDPHQEYDPPEPFASPVPPEGRPDRPRTPQQFLELYQEQRELPAAAQAVRSDYSGEVHYTDRCIGDVLRQVRALGLGESTLVVVAADHGEALNEGDGYYGHTLSLAEAVNRVPLILSGPGVASGVVNIPATMLDAAPTILALLSVDAPDGFQGRDLSPLLRRPDTDGAAARALAAPLLFTRGEDGRRAWLVDGMKASFNPEARITALHDLRHDPLERDDLLLQRPGLADDLTRRYMAPHTELAAMAATWADGPRDQVDADTARKLEKLGYIGE